MPQNRQLNPDAVQPPGRQTARKPSRSSLEALRLKAKACRACPLYKHATQTVFGEGPIGAKIMLVGEQPGDQEDKAGRPFVGPAGRLLDTALERARMPRAELYLTNTVKHFKYVRDGKRRLHAKPKESEIHACRPWLDSEISLIAPQVVVALGATAAKALAGNGFRVTRQRGQIIRGIPGIPHFIATIHPSAILRGPPADRERALRLLAMDLGKARSIAG
jgi:uracil-DNA glycosylase family protein